MSTIFMNPAVTPAFVMPAALSTCATAIGGAVAAEAGVRDRAAATAAKAAHWGHHAWSPPTL